MRLRGLHLTIMVLVAGIWRRQSGLMATGVWQHCSTLRWRRADVGQGNPIHQVAGAAGAKASRVLTSMGSVATGLARGRSPRPAPRTLHQLPRALRLSIGVPSFTGFQPLREVSLRQTKHRF